MNSPLDSYLRELRRSLRFVPLIWRDEQISEARQHLTARVEELTGVGMTPRDAEEEAVRHFGTAPQTARTLMVAWWRQFLPLDKATLRPALIAAFGFLLATLLQIMVANPLAYGLQSLGPYTFGATFPVVSQVMILLSCLLMGVAAGQWGGRRAVVGTFWGGWVAIISVVIAGRIRSAIQLNDPLVRQQYEDLMARLAQGDTSVSVMVIPPYVLWLQILLCLTALCLGAYVGGRRHQPTRVVI